MEELVYLEEPALYKPCLILGFEGWPNAAEVSSFCIDYLVERTRARKFASIRPGHFYQTSLSRPIATIREGRVLDLKIPGNHFYYATDCGPQDFIFFRGIEPHSEWSAFVELLLRLADRVDGSQILTVGGTYDYVPHSSPPVVSAVFNHDDLKERIVQAGLSLIEYTGPISIHTFLLERAKRKGMKVISLWGHAPHYLQAQNVKVAHSVVRKVVDLTGMVIDLSDLQERSDLFDRHVNRLMEEDPKLREAIRNMENLYRQPGVPRPSADQEGELESGENVVTIQAFLKRRDEEEKKES